MQLILKVHNCPEFKEINWVEESLDLLQLRFMLVTKGLVMLSDSVYKNVLDTGVVYDIRQHGKGEISEPPFSLL